MRKPLCIDLFCGLGGWTEGFLAEGWDVVGFDIERHVYGEQQYPAQLVIQDVLTLDGRQFRNADCIVASPPCQEFSYMAMPWSRAKQIAGALREEVSFPEGYAGSRSVKDLRALFDACFRIQREACEAAGHHIPMVVENVKGAQPWVGRSKANFGSFYFWGDVAMVGGAVVAGPLQFGNVARAARRTRKQPGRNFHFPEKYGIPSPSFHGVEHEDSVVAAMELAGSKNTGGAKTEGHANIRDAGTKQGGDWFGDSSPPGRFRIIPPVPDSRKAASAQIAKIPFPISSYIARAFKP